MLVGKWENSKRREAGRREGVWRTEWGKGKGSQSEIRIIYRVNSKGWADWEPGGGAF